MSYFKWYRKWRGGYWVYWHFVNWCRVDEEKFVRVMRERLGRPEWAFENYTGEER